MSEEPAPSARTKRTWPQRLTIVAAFVLAIGSFGAAGALYAGQRIIEDRNIAPAIIDPSRATTCLLYTSDAADDPTLV